MIFVAVGRKHPFDRLIKMVDKIMPELNKTGLVQNGPGFYLPRHMQYVQELSPRDFRRFVKEANCFVSHYSIGNMVIARSFNKPIIMFPRQKSHKDAGRRDDTKALNRFEQHAGIYIAHDEAKLHYYIENHASLTAPQAEENEEFHALMTHLQSIA
jgi:UDP-N-acetylglucosamine transferase subunit ALG13